MVNGRSCPAPPSAEPQAPEQLKQSLTPLPSCGPVGWGGGEPWKPTGQSQGDPPREQHHSLGPFLSKQGLEPRD